MTENGKAEGLALVGHMWLKVLTIIQVYHGSERGLERGSRGLHYLLMRMAENPPLSFGYT